MADVSNAAGKASREKRANRVWIDAAGKEVGEAEATGFRYEHLEATKEFGADKGAFTFQFGNPGTVETMCAIFGALTLCGNITNTWNGLGADEKPANPIEAIEERFQDMRDGKWVERTGFGGPRYDADKLAEAVNSVKPDSVEAYLAKINHAETGKAYAKTALAVPQVAAKYAELTGKAKTVDLL